MTCCSSWHNCPPQKPQPFEAWNAEVPMHPRSKRPWIRICHAMNKLLNTTPLFKRIAATLKVARSNPYHLEGTAGRREPYCGSHRICMELPQIPPRDPSRGHPACLCKQKRPCRKLAPHFPRQEHKNRTRPRLEQSFCFVPQQETFIMGLWKLLVLIFKSKRKQV